MPNIFCWGIGSVPWLKLIFLPRILFTVLGSCLLPAANPYKYFLPARHWQLRNGPNFAASYSTNPAWVWPDVKSNLSKR